MAGPELVPIVERDEARAAIVFVHGFGGSAQDTWGLFPSLLSDVPALSEWNIYSLGYSSKLTPDWHGVWTADPGIETLATYLNSRADLKPLKSMRTLAFIAHSMGGLIVQKALVDFPDLIDRVSHVLLYGTPSGGTQLAQSRLGRFLKRQAVDMGDKSDSFAPSAAIGGRPSEMSTNPARGASGSGPSRVIATTSSPIRRPWARSQRRTASSCPAITSRS